MTLATSLDRLSGGGRHPQKEASFVRVQSRQLDPAGVAECGEEINGVTFEQIPDLVLVAIVVAVGLQDLVHDPASFQNDETR